jgi:hypothetical protein
MTLWSIWYTAVKIVIKEKSDFPLPFLHIFHSYFPDKDIGFAVDVLLQKEFDALLPVYGSVFGNKGIVLISKSPFPAFLIDPGKPAVSKDSYPLGMPYKVIFLAHMGKIYIPYLESSIYIYEERLVA